MKSTMFGEFDLPEYSRFQEFRSLLIESFIDFTRTGAEKSVTKGVEKSRYRNHPKVVEKLGKPMVLSGFNAYKELEEGWKGIVSENSLNAKLNYALASIFRDRGCKVYCPLF